MNRIDMPPTAQEVFDATYHILQDDKSLVLVGGPVRDILLGLTPKDYDFATQLLPDEVERRIRAGGKRAYTVGKRWGTVGFRHEGHFIEITTYRQELYDYASRKPAVTFTDALHKDLARRDFTMNAMALRLDGTLKDPFDGAADLRAQIVRAVGKPKERFREDPLRMLRMVRFVARYGFTIDPQTAKAAQAFAYALTAISTERINTEMDGLIVGPHAVEALQEMARLGLLSFAVPLLAVQISYNQNTPYHRYTLWEHSLQTMQAVEPDVVLRWAALLHDIGKPFVRQEKPGRSSYVHHDRVGEVLVSMVAHHLRWSNERTKEVCALVRNHMDDASPLRAADNAAK